MGVAVAGTDVDVCSVAGVVDGVGVAGRLLEAAVHAVARTAITETSAKRKAWGIPGRVELPGLFVKEMSCIS